MSKSYLNWNTKFCTKSAHFRESGLVVWTTSPDVNVHPCGLQFRFLEPDLEGDKANRIGEDFKWRQVEVVGELNSN
jgi:hypothetical protein